MPAKKRRKARTGFIRQHGLSLTVAGILLMWLALFRQSDPATHLGGFFGNAIADWLGTLVIVIATKYLLEIGSAESRPPHASSRGPLTRFLVDHSLTIAPARHRRDVGGRVRAAGSDRQGGQVVGSIVSEWTQILAVWS